MKTGILLIFERKSKVGEEGRIFNINEKKLSDYSHSLDAGEYKTKDFRTYVGTTTAISAMKKEEPPKDFKEYKKKVMAVARQASAKLGNTPVVALQAYIDPRIFSEWRKGIES